MGRIRLTGLWRHSTSRGRHVSGGIREKITLEVGDSIAVFVNDFKEIGSHDPDFIAYLYADRFDNEKKEANNEKRNHAGAEDQQAPDRD